MGNKRVLSAYVALSLSMLVTFLIIKHNAPLLLDLELKWLVVAAVPVVVGLIAGNYIKTFKGLGIEVESLLQNPIATSGLVAADALDSLPGGQKDSVNALINMPPEEKARYKRLTFVSPRTHYYEEVAVGEYFMRLSALEFIEIIDDQQRFRALIIVEPFRERFKSDPSFRGQFVDAVHGGLSERFVELFASYYITESVPDSETLVNVARQVRRSAHGKLPVVDSNRKLQGVISTVSVEKRITDEVLSARA